MINKRTKCECNEMKSVWNESVCCESLLNKSRVEINTQMCLFIKKISETWNSVDNYGKAM